MAWNPPKSGEKSTRYQECEHRHLIAHDIFESSKPYNPSDILSSGQAPIRSPETLSSIAPSVFPSSMPPSESATTASPHHHTDPNKDSPSMTILHERGNSDGSFFQSTTGSIYHPFSRPRSRSDIPKLYSCQEAITPQMQASPWRSRLLTGKNSCPFKESSTGALVTPSPRRIIFPEHNLGTYKTSTNIGGSASNPLCQRPPGQESNSCDSFWGQSEVFDPSVGGVKLTAQSVSSPWTKCEHNEHPILSIDSMAGSAQGLVDESASLQIVGTKRDQIALPEQDRLQSSRCYSKTYPHQIDRDYTCHAHSGRSESIEKMVIRLPNSLDIGFEVSTKSLQAKKLADFIRSGGANSHGSAEKQLTSRFSQHNFAIDAPNPPQEPLGFAPNVLPSQDPLLLHFNLNGGISFEEIQQYNPFAEYWGASRPNNYGVIRISDIPYSTTQQEVVAIIGERAPIVKMPKNSGTYAIHIIMERSSAKSNDCFVEFETPHAAQSLVSRIASQGIHRRIRDRQVKFHVSSQEQLMKELFPRANCVTWNGNDPVIEEKQDGQTRFRGFVNSEEMVATVKWAQTPKRSRFSKGHPQRTYESVISLVEKYPWWAADKYTLKERDLIFKALYDQIKTLTEQLMRAHELPPDVRAQVFPSTLDHRLLTELLHAGLEVPAFSEYQRSQLIDVTVGQVGVPVYVTRIAPYWPFETIRKKNEATEQLVEYFASMFENFSMLNLYPPVYPRSVNEHKASVYSPFGNFVVHWPDNKQDLTMAEAASIEWKTIESVLMRDRFRVDS